MKETLEEQKDNLRKYLLRELPEADQEQIELRLMTDGEFSRRLSIAQDDLIDDFVTARLSDDEMESFRKNYVTTPERQQKLSFATALDRYVTEKAPGKTASVFEKLLAFIYSRPFEAALTTIGLFLVLGGIFFLVWSIQSGQNQDRQQAFARVNRPEETNVQFPVLKQNSENTRVLLLRQNIVREEGDPRTVEITAGVTLVRLLLELGISSYASFKGELQTAGGQKLASAENLKARDDNGAQFVVINIPTELLTRGDYQFKLIGINNDGRATDLGSYPFHVITR